MREIVTFHRRRPRVNRGRTLFRPQPSGIEISESIGSSLTTRSTPFDKAGQTSGTKLLEEESEEEDVEEEEEEEEGDEDVEEEEDDDEEELLELEEDSQARNGAS
jgi:hypothetical protein